MVKIYAGGWTVEELAAIAQELDRQGVQYTIDGDDLLLHDDHQERMVDMIVESITEYSGSYQVFGSVKVTKSRVVAYIIRL